MHTTEQAAVEAILSNIVSRIELGQKPKTYGIRPWYSHHTIDGFQCVRFHKQDVLPLCLDVPNAIIAQVAAKVNKHQLEFCTASNWFTFRLIA